MYHHVKKLMYTVDVGTPDPRFGNMLLEQFGGANGELAAAMQYSIQGMNCDNPGLKDGIHRLTNLNGVNGLIPVPTPLVDNPFNVPFMSDNVVGQELTISPS